MTRIQTKRICIVNLSDQISSKASEKKTVKDFEEIVLKEVLVEKKQQITKMKLTLKFPSYSEREIKSTIFFIVELPTRGKKTYVDPTNYDRPEDAICEFATEIDASRLYLEMLIGGGKNDMYFL